LVDLNTPTQPHLKLSITISFFIINYAAKTLHHTFMKDVLGAAVTDYFHEDKPQKLWIHNDYGPKEEMPIDIYFRDENKMSTIELAALKYCTGKILDIGACVGSHALALQAYGEDVTALEISPKAAAIMRLRGVQNVVEANFFDYQEKGFDTLLLMMNGIGLVSNIKGLFSFLEKAKTMLNVGGQIIFDSSDVSYLYDGSVPLAGDYFGEIRFQYEYKKQQTDWFTWLFVDQGTLYHIANEAGWKAEFLMEDENSQYLVRLTLKAS